jgi:hypothetical protein
MYRCRILNTDANVQTVSMAVRYYRFTSVHHIACGGGNRAACAAWAADTLAPNTSAREYEESLRIRFLELDLKPQAFARFWKDSRPPAQAYEAIAGRPYEDYLTDRAAPGPYRYRPGPTLRWAELAFASLVIMLSVALGVVSARRRIGVNA